MMESRSRRPGGRTAIVRAAVLRATGDMLVESGLQGLELTAVADRAGVGKSTVYRRWGSVPALVTDLLCDMALQSRPRADTGSLRGDLRANAALVRRTLMIAPLRRCPRSATAGWRSGRDASSTRWREAKRRRVPMRPPRSGRCPRLFTTNSSPAQGLWAQGMLSGRSMRRLRPSLRGYSCAAGADELISIRWVRV